MKTQFTSKAMFQVALPTGFMIALIWLFLQFLFFAQGWTIPGKTSLALFFSQLVSVFILLYSSFFWVKNKYFNGKISFGKLMLQGIISGMVAAICGALIYQFYVSSIHPDYTTWLQEMYQQIYLERGLTVLEIDKQLATNEWLNSFSGLFYGVCFVTGLTTLFSIIPAFVVSKNDIKNLETELA